MAKKHWEVGRASRREFPFHSTILATAEMSRKLLSVLAINMGLVIVTMTTNDTALCTTRVRHRKLFHPLLRLDNAQMISRLHSSAGRCLTFTWAEPVKSSWLWLDGSQIRKAIRQHSQPTGTGQNKIWLVTWLNVNVKSQKLPFRFRAYRGPYRKILYFSILCVHL